MDVINYRPIGIIHSPFKEPKGTPIQPAAAIGIDGTVEVFPEYVEGLKDIEGFSHIILIYHFHLAKGYSLKVKPFLDDQFRGVFATRAPARLCASSELRKMCCTSRCGHCGWNSSAGYQTLRPGIRCERDRESRVAHKKSA